jgi:hypothetical protein
MHTRYCPNCNDEFRADIERCSDCGGELEDRYDEEDGAPPPPSREQPPPEAPTPEEYRAVFSCNEGRPLKKAVAALTAAKVPFQTSGSATGFVLYVPETAVSAAAAALRGREGALVLPEDAEPSVGPEGGPCPACSATIPAGAMECPDCGLMVGDEPEVTED